MLCIYGTKEPFMTTKQTLQMYP